MPGLLTFEARSKGGTTSSRARAGDSAWGKKMVRQKAALYQRRAYPQLKDAWHENARRVANGQPLIPLPEVPAAVMNPYSVKVREARRLARRRKAYEVEQAGQQAKAAIFRHLGDA